MTILDSLECLVSNSRQGDGINVSWVTAVAVEICWPQNVDVHGPSFCLIYDLLLLPWLLLSGSIIREE